jgi:hypothetical protein
MFSGLGQVAGGFRVICCGGGGRGGNGGFTESTAFGLDGLSLDFNKLSFGC